MKTLLTVLVLFAFMANDVVFVEKVQQVQKLLLCEKRGCFVIADTLSWEKTSQKRGVKVKSEQFVVTIPANVIWVSLGSTVTVFKYNNAPPIVIGTETSDTSQLNLLLG